MIRQRDRKTTGQRRKVDEGLTWRTVHCSECGEPLQLRADVPEPVMCDACEMGGPLFR